MAHFRGVASNPNGVAGSIAGLITPGSGISITGGGTAGSPYNISATSGGTVTAVSIVTANGFSGTSSGGATPALTLTTSVTGLLKGNGTAISAAVAGTDYQSPGNYLTALTGDATASGPGSAALTLATVNSNVGTFNNVTVNAKGLVTSASNITYQAPITLTTTGTGAATFISNTLNIPTPGASSPAGSNTQVQFNNSGAFGASSGLTWNGTSLAATDVQTATINQYISSNFSIGDAAAASGGSALAFGDASVATGTGATAIGVVDTGGGGTTGASAVGNFAVAIGTGATVDTADYAIAIGCNDPNFYGNPYINAEQGIAIGGGSVVSGAGAATSIAIGPCSVSGGGALALGLGTASGDASISISTGLGAANGTSAIAIGGHCTAGGTNSITLGNRITVSGNNSLGLGVTSNTGTNANISGAGSLGIVMQNQSSRTLSANNMMMLLGGTFIIDPRTGSGGTAITASRSTLDIGYSTDSVILPTGSTAQRPGTPIAGMIRQNSDTNSIETYGASVWKTGMYRTAISNASASATSHGLDTLDVVALTSLTASRTITFTPAGTATNPKQWCVKDEAGNAGTFAIVLASTSGTFDGLSTTSIATNSGSKTFYDNGTNFFMY